MSTEPNASSNSTKTEQNIYFSNALGLTEVEMAEDIEDVLSNMQFDELKEIEPFIQSLSNEDK